MIQLSCKIIYHLFFFVHFLLVISSPLPVCWAMSPHSVLAGVGTGSIHRHKRRQSAVISTRAVSFSMLRIRSDVSSWSCFTWLCTGNICRQKQQNWQDLFQDYSAKVCVKVWDWKGGKQLTFVVLCPTELLHSASTNTAELQYQLRASLTHLCNSFFLW